MTIAMGYVTIFMYGMCIRAILVNPKVHRDAIIAIALHFSLFALLLSFGWDELVTGLLIPLTVACGAGSLLFYMQHNFPGCHLNSRED